MTSESDHPELQSNLSLIETGVANVHSVLVRLSQQLSSLDGVEYNDFSVSDRSRVLKQEIKSVLESWDNVCCFVCSTVLYLFMF